MEAEEATEEVEEGEMAVADGGDFDGVTDDVDAAVGDNVDGAHTSSSSIFVCRRFRRCCSAGRSALRNRMIESFKTMNGNGG